MARTKIIINQLDLSNTQTNSQPIAIDTACKGISFGRISPNVDSFGLSYANGINILNNTIGSIYISNNASSNGGIAINNINNGDITISNKNNTLLSLSNSITLSNTNAINGGIFINNVNSGDLKISSSVNSTTQYLEFSSLTNKTTLRHLGAGLVIDWSDSNGLIMNGYSGDSGLDIFIGSSNGFKISGNGLGSGIGYGGITFDIGNSSGLNVMDYGYACGGIIFNLSGNGGKFGIYQSSNAGIDIATLPPSDGPISIYNSIGSCLKLYGLGGVELIDGASNSSLVFHSQGGIYLINNTTNSYLKLYLSDGLVLRNGPTNSCFSISSNGSFEIRDGVTGNDIMSTGSGDIEIVNAVASTSSIFLKANGDIDITAKRNLNLYASKIFSDSDIEFNNNVNGIIMKSRIGTKKFRLYISDDNGTLAVEEVV